MGAQLPQPKALVVEKRLKSAPWIMLSCLIACADLLDGGLA
jgi:hypothetical protein